MTKIAGIDFSGFLPSVAAKLAHMDDHQQAAFFNVFADELLAVCGTSYNAEMQACSVKNLSSDEFKRFCGMVAYEETAS